jgi:hypothetical protein
MHRPDPWPLPACPSTFLPAGDPPLTELPHPELWPQPHPVRCPDCPSAELFCG